MKSLATLILVLSVMGARTDELAATSINSALADPARPAQDIALDEWRHPEALLTFAGLKRGDKVADFMSGNGYFTRLFSRMVGAQGRVYAFLPTRSLPIARPMKQQAPRRWPMFNASPTCK